MVTGLLSPDGGDLCWAKSGSEQSNLSSEWMTLFLWGRAPIIPAAEAAAVCSVLK